LTIEKEKLMFRQALISCATIALLGAAAANAQDRQTMDFTINVGTKDQNGVCSIYLAGEGQLELELSVRADDGNVNVAVHNIPSDWIDNDANPAIRLRSDDGTVFNSAGGAYRAGFTYRVMSFYDAPEDGLRVLSALNGGEAFTASVDNHNAGNFEIQQTSENMRNYAHTWLQNCVESNGGNLNF